MREKRARKLAEDLLGKFNVTDEIVAHIISAFREDRQAGADWLRGLMEQKSEKINDLPWIIYVLPLLDT